MGSEMSRIREAVEASWKQDTAYDEVFEEGNPALGQCYPTSWLMQYFYPLLEIVEGEVDTGKSIDTIIEEKGLAQVSDDSTLQKLVVEIIDEHKNIAEQIRGGREGAIGFLVGQAMQKTQGRANPKKIGEIIKKTLIS